MINLQLICCQFVVRNWARICTKVDATTKKGIDLETRFHGMETVSNNCSNKHSSKRVSHTKVKPEKYVKKCKKPKWNYHRW